MSTANRPNLPIDSLIPDILTHLRESQGLVIEAPPGAGKTTRVPPALLSVLEGEVIVLEPRRLAARLAARRVALEMGERVGETAGYQVRFEAVAGPRTRLRFMTEGVLTRRLLSDPGLRGVSAVILDEFHERHLEGDLALALLRRLQATTRPDLKVLVMSATLESAPVASFLGGCPVLRSEGRQFEVLVEYTPSNPNSLDQQAAAALQKLARKGLDGHVLVFLPGAMEIRRAMRACQPVADRFGLSVLPLHGDLSPEEQDRAVAPCSQHRVILSTNVAESSVTIEGVTAVIDSGLARIASQSPWTGLPQLTVTRISKAPANQRAGRAGRTRPGSVIRLYAAEDYHRRPEHDVPEILRAELSQLVLSLAELGINDPLAMGWIDAPPAVSIEAARDLLSSLRALDRQGNLTRDGRRMIGMPLHPRLARLVVEAADRGVVEQGCAAAAVLSAGERLPHSASTHAASSDLFILLESDWAPGTRRTFEQIRRIAPGNGSSKRGGDEQFLMAVLATFPDRVARRRQASDLLLSSGGSAVLADSSVVRSNFLVAVDVEERRERGLPLVRIASAIEPDWLIDLFPERMSERSGLEWNRASERVEQTSALMYDNLIVSETRGAPSDAESASRMLYDKAIEAGIERFANGEELESYLSRVAFASQYCSLPTLDGRDLGAALEMLCQGRRSFADLKSAAADGGFIRALEGMLPGGAARLLSEYAPARIRLPRGRQVKVQYARDQAPWIASRLQDFFGMRETPRVAGRVVPLVVHLLAPNNRPVQMTSDLAGFWTRLYPQVRRELCRRYPKHSWPDDPTVSGA